MFKVQPHNSDSITRGDYITAESISRRESCVGVSYSFITSLYSVPREYNPEELKEYMSKLYDVKPNARLEEIIQHLTNLENSSYDFCVSELGELITRLVNTFLSKCFRCDVLIDDIYMDVEELVKHFAGQAEYKFNFTLLENLINNIFQVNKRNIDFIIKVMQEDNWDMKTGDDVKLYTYPIIIPYPIVGLCGGFKDHNIFRLKILFDRIEKEKLVNKSDELFSIIKTMEDSCPEFKDFGFIEVYTTGLSAFPFSRNKFVIYRTKDEEYLVVK